jgi:hypothetical protein
VDRCGAVCAAAKSSTLHQRGDSVLKRVAGSGEADETEYKEEGLRKKKYTPSCPIWTDTEKPKKSKLYAKDSPDYDKIKEESEGKEEEGKRCSLCDRAPKQTSV